MHVIISFVLKEITLIGILLLILDFSLRKQATRTLVSEIFSRRNCQFFRAECKVLAAVRPIQYLSRVAY